MVRDRWYVILETRELPRSGPLGVVRMGERLALWRNAAGELVCTGDDCPHRGAALSMGKVVDGCIQCPFHGFEFAQSGQCTKIPANGPDGPIPSAMRVKSYPVREHKGFVWLWYGDATEQLPPVPWFEEIDDSYVYDTLTDDWDTHYTRAIENQLDFTHLPFAHHNTIGRGVPGKLGVITQVDGDRIRVSYDPETHDAKGFFVELWGPNLWRNRLAEGVWVVAVFVPVDDNNTRLYLRFYQRFLTLPLIGPGVCWLSNLLNRYILDQDKRIVLTQEPRSTQLRMKEVLIPSDRPIIEYRKWRHARLQETK